MLPQSVPLEARVMMFVDGENLANRYAALLANQPTPTPASHVRYEPGVFVWSLYASMATTSRNIIRRHYYSSSPGDEPRQRELELALRTMQLEAPRIFPRNKTRGSKRVDISLATDMLTHAHRQNYDVAILVAGDEDYVPLVEAVAGEGRRVVLWFVENGLSPALVRAADHFWNIGELLFMSSEDPRFIHYFG